MGSGLAASLGVSAESVFGTYVAPTRFYEFNSESLAKVKNVAQGGGLAGGRYGRLGSRRVVTTAAAEGSFELEVANAKMGLLFSHLMGSAGTPVQQAATAAYLQTHALADNVGKFLTIQKGVPDLAGTVRPYTVRGAKITSAEFSCGVDEMLTMGVEVDGQQVSEAESLATPSYTTGLAPFHFGQMALKLGTYASEVAVDGVKSVSMTIERPQYTDRFYANQAGLKKEQLVNDFPVVSGTIATDYVDKTLFADRFAADTSTSLVWEFVGPLIASTYYQTFRITVPMVFFDEGTPQVEGPEVVAPSYTFVGQLDGTNPLATISYTSTDTAI